jgi:Domain of unknown function (DUF4440)
MRSPTKHTLATLLLLSTTLLTGCRPSDESSRKYIEDSERQWAESVATNNSEVLERILADDFVWILDGRKLTKAEAIADAKAGPGDFLSDHVDEINVRFYGNTAVAQGSETWTRNNPNHPKGRFVWTDTWLYRNGKWQIVAAEDLVAPAKP